jgi:DNA-binding beta-propeller fold protein YncE
MQMLPTSRTWGASARVAAVTAEVLAARVGSTLVVVAIMGVVAGCGSPDDSKGGGGNKPPAPPGPPTEIVASLGACPGLVDRYSFDVVRGRSVTLTVDSVDADTAADLCLFGRCGAVDVGGDDEIACAYPPSAYGCPYTQITTRRAGTCTIDVGVCSSVCANGPSADYLLTVSVDGGGPDVTALADDLAIASRNGLCADGDVDSAPCSSNEDCPNGVCQAFPGTPLPGRGELPSATTTLPEGTVQRCNVRFEMLSDATYGTLQFKVDYHESRGALVGRGSEVECEREAGGSGTFTDHDAAHVLSARMLSGHGVQGPHALVSCAFDASNDEPTGPDFLVTVTEASSLSGEPIDPLIFTRVTCATTSTTLTTITTTTTPGATVPDTTTTTLASDECGSFLRAWGSSGTADGQFDGPGGIAADGSRNSVYVADTGNDRIQKFDLRGGFVRAWGATGTGDGELLSPAAIAVAPNGDVYVADTGNDRIQVFDRAGNFIGKWGTHGSDDGELDRPAGIAVDPDGAVVVTEAGNRRVQKFTAIGTFLRKWGTAGTEAGQFALPLGVDTGGNGNVFVTDASRNVVVKFDDVGTWLTELGSPGSGDGQLMEPWDVFVEGGGDVFILDSGNGRVQKFDYRKNLLGAWGNAGSGNGELAHPRAIAGIGGGIVFIADTDNDRIQKFACP